MPRTRPPYPPEFRRQMVDLVRSGRTPEELSREFEPTAVTIASWVHQADRDAGRRGDGLTSEERYILAKAAAWFARQSRATPSGSTGS